MMDTGWIEAVMRINEAIVAAGAHFNAQIIDLVDTADRGQDTAKVEVLLQEHERKLALLRAIQAQLLQKKE